MLPKPIRFTKGMIHMKPEIEKLLARADEWISAHRQEFIEEIQTWARIPSVSRADLAEPGAPFGPECRRVLETALERGRHYGFETVNHDGYAGSIYMGDYADSLGVIGHLDVVPVGDGWIYPQFGATYLPEYDALVGRGVGDNKGPAVAGLFAMRMLRDFGWPLRHGLRLICGLSEETGMQDMVELGKRGVVFPKTSLVPDAGFPVNYGQKGSVDAEISADCRGTLTAFDSGTVRNVIPDRAECVLALEAGAVAAALDGLDGELRARITSEPCEGGTRVVAHGKPGHAASPDGGINAIALLTRALDEAALLTGSCADAIRNLKELTADSYGESEGVAFSDDISGKLTLVYGVAHLRDGVLTVSVDCRSSIKIDQEWLLATLKADWARRGYSIVRISHTKPFYIPKDDARVVALQQLYKDITGRDDEPYTMGGGTYSRVVPNAISYGPGIPGDDNVKVFLPEGHGGAHGMDEVLYIDKVIACMRIYVAALAMLDEIVD